MNMGGELDDLDWRTFQPTHFHKKVNDLINRRLA
jgi:hypothetical protein